MQSNQNNNKPESKVKRTLTEKRQNLTQYLILSPYVVYYPLPLCFCPTSSVYAHCANNTPAKLIESIHTYKQTEVRASILAPSWHEHNTVAYPVRAFTRGRFPIKRRFPQVDLGET